MDGDNNNGSNIPDILDISLPKKPLKWSTLIKYQDIKTGEALNKKHVKSLQYIVIHKKVIKYNKHENNIQKEIIHYCKKNNQLTIKY